MRLRTADGGAEMNIREKLAQARKMRRTIEVECIGECDIEEFSTEVLIDELRRRQATVPREDRDEIMRAYEALSLSRSEEALWILERLLWPKFASVEACEQAKTRP
jgi:hypothetical protein